MDFHFNIGIYPDYISKKVLMSHNQKTEGI